MAPDPEQPDAEPASTVSSAASAANAVPSNDAPGQARRGLRASPAIEPSDIQGLKYFDTLKPV